MSASEFVPESADLDGLAQAARGCKGCELWENATQTVFGDGPSTARVVLVGEQPGDVEDRRGEPFVGPAGRLLDKALVEAGIDREDAYVTNAVKHFRFTGGSGKRRIHAKPDMVHVTACRPWLTAELALLSPEVVVCLGATAAASLLGPSFRVTKQHGQLMPFESATSVEDAGVHASWILGTVHPSAILRTPDERRDAAYAGFVADLHVAAEALS
jgi:DNA polymerase